MEFFKHFAKGIGGGVCIGIGGTVFLSVLDPLIGGALFSVGLFTILLFRLNLYTGKVGYIPERPLRYVFEDVLPSWLGNFAGVVLLAKSMLLTHRGQALVQRAEEISAAKLSGSLLSLFILSVLCGLMVYFMVEAYRRYSRENMGSAMLYCALCVEVFLLSGFEHSIADMYFFTMAGCLSRCLPELLLISLGNLLGGCLMPGAKLVCTAMLSLAEAPALRRPAPLPKELFPFSFSIPKNYGLPYTK